MGFSPQTLVRKMSIALRLLLCGGLSLVDQMVDQIYQREEEKPFNNNQCLMNFSAPLLIILWRPGRAAGRKDDGAVRENCTFGHRSLRATSLSGLFCAAGASLRKTRSGSHCFLLLCLACCCTRR